MIKRMFVDTGAFLALANPADQYHEEAVRTFAHLQLGKTVFITTNFVLDETYTRIQRKAGLKVAIEFGRRLQEDRDLTILTIEKSLEKLAWDIFSHDLQHGFSYTDCTSFALMRRKKMSEAFTFDKHFKAFGWRVYPSV